MWLTQDYLLLLQSQHSPISRVSVVTREAGGRRPAARAGTPRGWAGAILYYFFVIKIFVFHFRGKQTEALLQREHPGTWTGCVSERCPAPCLQQRVAVVMDKILEAVVTSSYPASVKQGLVRRVLEAARQPLEREQCLALLALGARLYVGGAEELPRRVGCQLLHVAGRHHPDVFAEFFSARRVLRLLQGGAGPPGARALACVQLGLQLLPDGPAADEVFALLRREVLRTVCERPGPATCAQVARLLARHPRCVPDGAHRLLFCQQLVRCLGRFRCPAEGEEGAVEFLEQAQQVSGLLAQLWRAQPAAILPCLKELFAVISCTGAWAAQAGAGTRAGPDAGCTNRRTGNAHF